MLEHDSHARPEIGESRGPATCSHQRERELLQILRGEGAHREALLGGRFGGEPRVRDRLHERQQLCDALGGHDLEARAIALGPSLPRILAGKETAVAVNNLNDFSVGGRNPKAAPISNTFEAMYANSVDTALHGTGQETFDAVRMLKEADPAKYTPAASTLSSATLSKGTLTMFGWAGWSRVAVGGAHPEVRAMADEITLTNDEDGVAVYLDRLLSNG